MYTTVFLRSLPAWALTGAALFGMSAPPAGATSSFTLFESGQVRPLALSPDGKRLYAVNTPDNRLEIFRIGKHGLRHRGSVPVGLEPVAVAVRADGACARPLGGVGRNVERCDHNRPTGRSAVTFFTETFGVFQAS